ncbi:MAG: hypothetical protein JXA25_13790, partial [Anaerolineales bacterium]|nr:hypothetical protein [Anaerolineales bacterium]
EEQAFGNQEDWTINLGSRPAVLHPGFKQWLWYDRLHDEWIFAGCGVGEAVLVTSGSTAGIKKLPDPGLVRDWCLYQDQQSLAEPLRVGDLRTMLKNQEVSSDILVWSTQAADWFAPTDEVGKKILG